MGIQGLLPFVKEATQPVNMRKYGGYAVAVDTYCWLHKGAFACSLQLAKGEQTNVYVKYCLKFVNMLRSMDVRPILVFDGCTLPAKKHVEKSRRERRKLYNEKGRQFLREGKVSEARDCFNKCVNVTPQMALEVMKAARSLGVDCIAAPYEADAQLAYLHKMGIVQAVITEDSDLIAFGCKRVIVKMDLNGNGLEIDSSKLNQAMKIGAKYSMDKFRYMCIIAGCDYLPSLPGIGLGKARKLFTLATNPDMSVVVKRMNGFLKLKQSVPAEYVEGFHKANNTFLHQLAFDPRKRKLVPLNPYPDGTDPKEMKYAGKYLPDQQAYHVALGNTDINTMERIYDFDPERTKRYDRDFPRHKLSIWHKDYRIGPDLADEDLTEVERNQTKGKEVTVKMKPCKRPREEDIPDEQPTDNDLASMYNTAPAAKRKPLDPVLQEEVIPETPSPCKTKTSRQIVADRLLEKAKSPRRSPRRNNMFAVEKAKSPRRRKNIFAVKGRKSWDRKSHLQEGDKVTSRFFSAPPPPPDEDEEEETTNPWEGNDDNLQTDVIKTEVADSNEGADDDEPVKSEWAWGDAERSNPSKVSALDKLQSFQFHRSSSAPTLSKRIKDEVEIVDLSAGVKKEAKGGILFYAKPGQKDEELGDDEMIIKDEDEIAETKASTSLTSSQSSVGSSKGISAFSWGGKKADKGKKKPVTGLDIFRSTYSASSQKSKMKKFTNDEQSRTQESQELDSEQYSQISSVSDKLSFNMGEDSQERETQCSISMSQSSNMYSMDADALSYSQFGVSRPNTPGNSQSTSQDQRPDFLVEGEWEDLGNHGDVDVEESDSAAKNSDNNYAKVSVLSTPRLPSLGDLEESVEESSQGDTDSPKISTSPQLIQSKLLSIPAVQDNSQECGISQMANTSTQNLFSERKTSHSFYSASMSSVSSVKAKEKTRVTGKLSEYFSKDRITYDGSKDSQDERSSSEDTSDSNVEEDKKDVRCIDLTDDDDFETGQKNTRAINKKSQDKKVLLKKTQSSSRLPGSRASGLSKKRRKSNNKKTDENSAGKQMTIFSFMKKTQDKKANDKKTGNPSDGPMSPVKTNIQDVTPEGDNSIVKKDIKKITGFVEDINLLRKNSFCLVESVQVPPRKWRDRAKSKFSGL